MIRLTTLNGSETNVDMKTITEVRKAGPATQAHGIASIVLTSDGLYIEARESAAEITAAIKLELAQALAQTAAPAMGTTPAVAAVLARDIAVEANRVAMLLEARGETVIVEGYTARMLAGLLAALIVFPMAREEKPS